MKDLRNFNIKKYTDLLCPIQLSLLHILIVLCPVLCRRAGGHRFTVCGPFPLHCFRRVSVTDWLTVWLSLTFWWGFNAMSIEYWYLVIEGFLTLLLLKKLCVLYVKACTLCSFSPLQKSNFHLHIKHYNHIFHMPKNIFKKSVRFQKPSECEAYRYSFRMCSITNQTTKDRRGVCILKSI